MAIDLQLLRQSDNPEQRSLVDIVDAISDLRAALMSIDRKLDIPVKKVPNPKFLHDLGIIIERLLESNDSITTGKYLKRLREMLKHLNNMIE